MRTRKELSGTKDIAYIIPLNRYPFIAADILSSSPKLTEAFIQEKKSQKSPSSQDEGCPPPLEDQKDEDEVNIDENSAIEKALKQVRTHTLLIT